AIKLPIYTSTDVCKPVIDATWKNLVTDYGADPGGGRDSSPAIDSWLAYGVSQNPNPVKLYIPPGTYKLSGTNAITNGIRNATISGWGATVDNLFMGNANLAMTFARIADVSAGATAVTILAADGTLALPADVTGFSVGQWILIHGLALQSPPSFPPNSQYAEYRQITAINGSVLTLGQGLTNSYKANGPLVDSFATTINIATSTFTTTAVTITNNGQIQFTTSGALPNDSGTGLPLGTNQTYFVVGAVGNSYKIANTQGGTALTLSGTQSGTHYVHGKNTNIDWGGPATIIGLESRWDGVHNYYGLACSNAGAIACGSQRSMTVCGMTFTGLGPAPSFAKNFTIQRSTVGQQNEVDKMLESLIYDTCTGTQLLFQSSTGGSVTIKNSTFGTINGVARNTTITNCNITGDGVGNSLIDGPVSYGHGEILFCCNNTFATTLRQAPLFVDPSTLSFSSGTFSILINTADTLANSPFQWAVPNCDYYFARDGQNVADDGLVHSFRITAVRQDATKLYFDTDIVGALPNPLFGGLAANRYTAYAAQTVTGPASFSIFSRNAITLC